MKYFKILITFIVVSYGASLLAKTSTQSAAPTHLVFMVFDQMRPDYIDRFDLKNFKRLRKISTNYNEAYVGHLASVTVVSHAVMTTGLLPKDLPWSENTFWDRKGLLGDADQIYNTLTLAQDQYKKLLLQIPADQFLIKRFKDKTRKKVFVVGEKDYATLALGGPYSDTIIYAQKKSGVCKPFGVNVPQRILEQNRFVLDCEKDYGTKNSLYPLDGNRFFPGNDPAHLGGDIWVADLGLDIMRNEKDWGALFMTFGAIDKFGHMLGETGADTPHAFETPAHLSDIAQIADKQLGKILDELEKQKMMKETMIVITADHGGQTDEIFLGGNGSTEPFWIQRISQMASLKVTAADTGVRLWLKEPTRKNIEKTIQALKEIAQVTEIYSIDHQKPNSSYKLEFEKLKTQPKAFQKWALNHNAEIVNSIANENSADLVVSLSDKAGFGKLGDHGGLQEKVQRIPMLVFGPEFKASTQTRKMRLVDLAPLISHSFDLKAAPVH
jgi:hypothetical protein